MLYVCTFIAAYRGTGTLRGQPVLSIFIYWCAQLIAGEGLGNGLLLLVRGYNYNGLLLLVIGLAPAY